MQIGVLKYPGGNGDDELRSALTGLNNNPVHEIWYKEAAYPYLDILFIASGFPCSSDEENEYCFKDAPALRYMHEFASMGKMLVGIGNGFRVLCEADLLPGNLEENHTGRFLSRYVFVKPENHSNILTAEMSEEQVLHLPVATEYGNYVADSDVLAEMRLEGQILLRFCDEGGRISEAVNFTGSTENIAGICNRNKNVFGLIPLPDRAVNPLWYDTDGKIVLRSLLEAIKR